jgi:hypothetical protein
LVVSLPCVTGSKDPADAFLFYQPPIGIRPMIRTRPSLLPCGGSPGADRNRASAPFFCKCRPSAALAGAVRARSMASACPHQAGPSWCRKLSG